MKKSRAFVLFSLCLLLVGVFGCQSGTVAEVNGDKISRREFKQALARSSGGHSVAGAEYNSKEAEQSVLDELIAQKLFLQEAKARSITVTDSEVDAEITRVADAMGRKNFEQQLASSKMTEAEYRQTLKTKMTIDRTIDAIAPPGEITEKEMMEYYKNSPRPFLKPESVEVRFIETPSESEAMEVLEEIKRDKGNFDAVADRLSRESKFTVSSYGWTQAQFFGAAIKLALQDLKQGSYGGPYQGKEGFFLLKVRHRKAAGVESFEEAEPEIRNILLVEKRHQIIPSFIADKRKVSRITINL